jgi:hypothetical protein
VAQGVDLEFKPQCHEKERRNETKLAVYGGAHLKSQHLGGEAGGSGFHTSLGYTGRPCNKRKVSKDKCRA